MLGDVRHDPLQCFYGFNELYLQKKDKNILKLEKKAFAELWNEIFDKYGNEIIRNEKGHEAIMFPKEEKVFTLGLKDGKVVLSRILSMNRQPFEGHLIDLNIGEKTISITPEHKKNKKKNSSKEAEKISIFDKIILLKKAEELKVAISAIKH